MVERMNERIQELEKQAFDAVWDLDNDPIGPGTHFKPDGFEQKFAELIVRECAEVAGCNGHVSGFTLGDLIKEHFGVEE